MKNDPVEYPKIKIGDKEYTVKFRASDVIKLKETYNIDLMSGEGMVYTGTAALQMCANVISVGVAHEAQVTPAEILDNADISDFGDLIVAVQASQKKALDRSMEKIKTAREAGTIFALAQPPKEQPAPVPTLVQ